MYFECTNGGLGGATYRVFNENGDRILSVVISYPAHVEKFGSTRIDTSEIEAAILEDFMENYYLPWKAKQDGKSLLMQCASTGQLLSIDYRGSFIVLTYELGKEKKYIELMGSSNDRTRSWTLDKDIANAGYVGFRHAVEITEEEFKKL